MTRIDPRTWLALLAPVALLLSGCVASATQDSSEAPLAADGALAAADADGNAAADGAARAPAADGVETSTMPVAIEGETGLAGFACFWAVVINDCEGALVPVTPVETWFPQDLDGALRGVDLTMTWDAATPVGEELLLGLALTRGGETEWITEAGPSPLRLQRAALDVAPDTEVAVYVWTACDGAVVAWTCTTDPQPFRIEGTLQVAPSA